MINRPPPEITQMILSYSRPWNLPTLSLVCRLWQTLAFPFLHRTIFFDKYKYATLLVDRINAETKETPLRITDCARNLIIDLDTSYPLSFGLSDEELDHKRISLAISKLVNVEKLSLGPNWLSAELEILIPTTNPWKLKYLSLKLEPSHIYDCDIERVFDFKDLLEVSVKMSSGVFSREPPEPVTLLAAMIRASPKLESLSLMFNLYELEEDTEALSTEDLFSQLSNVIFPHLRILRAVSPFISPTSPALRQFLHNHPKLSTLDFGSVHKSMPRTIGVDEVVAVAPAVRHFEGPAFLVKPLLQSEISGQLESLSICGTVFLDKELEPMMQELSRTPLSKLSALRTLRVEPQISFKHLTHILKAAPELERLEFFGWINSMYGISEYSDDLLQMLKLVPCLRVLTVTKFNKIDDQDEQDEQDEYLQLTHASVMRFLDHATATCPQLDTIHHMEYGIWVGTWRLRELGSNERVRVYAYRKLYHLFPSLGVLCVEYPDRLGPWHRLHEID